MGDVFSELPLSGFHAFRVIYKLQKGKSVAHAASLLICIPSVALLESDTLFSTRYEACLGHHGLALPQLSCPHNIQKLPQGTRRNTLPVGLIHGLLLLSYEYLS
jgi:hypothetical protein